MIDYLVKVESSSGFVTAPAVGRTVGTALRSRPPGATKGTLSAQIVTVSHAYPEAIDTGERRQGVIAYIDRVASGSHEPVIEDIALDADRVGASS